MEYIARKKRPDIQREQEHWNEVHEQLQEFQASERVQKKSLTISNSGDAGELEAEQVSRKIMSGESVEIHGAGSTVNRKSESNSEVTPEFQTKLEGNKGAGQSLDDSIRTEMEPKFGADFGAVKIHTGSEAHGMSEGINATAFTHGQDIYFKNGAYQPNSDQGKELLAHELTHTVQQSSTDIQPQIQRFEPWEHKVMGDDGSEGQGRDGGVVKMKVGSLTLTLGDVTALAGDFFGSVEELKKIAEKPGDNGQLPGTADEVNYILDYYINGRELDETVSDRYSSEVKEAVEDRGTELLKTNWDHFSNSETGDVKLTHDERAEKHAGNKALNNAAAYRDSHEKALAFAFYAGKSTDKNVSAYKLNEAWLHEGFASHFLTDAFSSGHVSVERKSIVNYWKKKIPMWMINLHGWFSETLIKGAQRYPYVDELPGGALDIIIQIFGQDFLPSYELGDIIGGMLHDYDNIRGIDVTVAGTKATLYGDGEIVKQGNGGGNKKSSALADSDKANTLDLVTSAMQVSTKEVNKALSKGKAAQGKSIGIADVRPAFLTTEGLYGAEIYWPVAESTQSAGRRKINWKADSLEDLVEKEPIFLKLVQSYSKERLLPAFEKLEQELYKEHWDWAIDLLQPILGEVKKHFQPDELAETLQAVVDYTPGSIIDNDDWGRMGDEYAANYVNNAKDLDAMKTLTVSQRVKLVRAFLQGPTMWRDESKAAEVIVSCPEKDIVNMFNGLKTEDITGWAWVFDDVGGDSLKAIIIHAGPLYWKQVGYDEKYDECYRLIGSIGIYTGLVWLGELTQLTIMIILRSDKTGLTNQLLNVDFSFNKIMDEQYHAEIDRLVIPVQRKGIEVSKAGDPDELEADAVASKIVNGQSAEIKASSGNVNRKGEGGTELTSDFKSQLDSSKGSGNPLEENVRGEMESKMNADFSDVKVHTDSTAATMSESINAKAFTHGQDIYFKGGQHNTSSNEGKELLAHELVHTVQQGSGKVQPKIQRVADWTADLDMSKALDKTIIDEIEKNRNAINISTGLVAHKKGYYYYPDKAISENDNPSKNKNEKNPFMKKLYQTVWDELKLEGSISSINSYDDQLVTWGKGISGKSYMADVIKDLGAKSTIKQQFLDVGIYYNSDGIILVDTNADNYGMVLGRVEKEVNKKKIYEYPALEIIQKDKRLLSFLINLSEHADTRADVLDAQWNNVLKHAGKIPSYVYDLQSGTEDYGEDKGKFLDNWNEQSVAFAAHLSHWLYSGSWEISSNSYKNTLGEPSKILIQFVKYISSSVKKKLSNGATVFQFDNAYDRHIDHIGAAGKTKTAGQIACEDASPLHTLTPELLSSLSDMGDFILIRKNLDEHKYYVLPNDLTTSNTSAQTSFTAKIKAANIHKGLEDVTAKKLLEKQAFTYDDTELNSMLEEMKKGDVKGYEKVAARYKVIIKAGLILHKYGITSKKSFANKKKELWKDTELTTLLESDEFKALEVQDQTDLKSYLAAPVKKKSLDISQPTDPDEIEADEAARKVVSGQDAEIKTAGATVNAKSAGSSEATPEFQSKLEINKGSGQSLDETTRSEMESKMGSDFSGVKVHTSSEASQMSEDINAKAFAHGQDIYFKQGEYDTQSKSGKELLAHELTHTVQQTEKVLPKIHRKDDDMHNGLRFADITLPYDCTKVQTFDHKKNVLKRTYQEDGKPLTSVLIGTGLEENTTYILKLYTEDGVYDYYLDLVKTQFISIFKAASNKIQPTVSGERVKFIAKEGRTTVNPNSTAASNIVILSDNETNEAGVELDDSQKHVVNEDIKGDYDTAKAKVTELTGEDLGLRFGDAKRPLSLTGGSAGADNITWHKTGRAIDIGQQLPWTIRKDEHDDGMYFILYLPLQTSLDATIGTSPDNQYIETFPKGEEANFFSNAIYDRKLVNVTQILEANGFARIKAHKGWEKSWAKREWWHYEKREGLTMYQALRQVHTEQQIVDGYRAVITAVPLTRIKYESRFIREGFPGFIVKSMYTAPVKYGSLSLWLSVGEHQSQEMNDIANFPDDVAALHTALFKLGYDIVPGVNVIQPMDIVSIKEISKSLLGTEQSAILVGDALHQKIGSTLTTPSTKGSLTLYSSVGEGKVNLAGDVKATKEVLNRGFKAGKMTGVMTHEFQVNRFDTPAFYDAIRNFQTIIMKSKAPDGVISKGGGTHIELGKY